MRRYLVLIALAGALIGCAEPVVRSASIEVENMRLVRKRNGTQVVSGVVRNLSERTRSAQLEISLYGNENELLGAVHVPIEHLEGGDVKGFHWSLDEEVTGVRLRQILAL